MGIIGSNDLQARRTIETLREIGWEIPQQVAIIGIDNDSLICESCPVPITSIGIDTLRWGSTALDTILAILDGQTPQQPVIWVPPMGVVERESTLRNSLRGDVIDTMQQLLKSHRALRWNTQHLALQIGVAPTTLTRHCRATLGTTPRQLLHQARLRRAEELPRKSAWTVEAIAQHCGWQAPQRMVIAFRKAHGMTPSAYRNRARNHPNH